MQGTAGTGVGANAATTPKTALRVFDPPPNPRHADRLRNPAPRLAISARHRKPTSKPTLYGYDAAGRLQGITDVALGATTMFQRDSAGRVTKTTDALGHETHTSYKLGGRLKDTTNARGFTTAFDRDPTSSAITDALTRTTVTSLTAFGLPTSTAYPGGAATSSAYAGTTRLDASQSFPTSFNDELERARTFSYDAHSGLTSTTDLAGAGWQYTYGASKGSAISYDVFSGDVGLSHHQGGAQAYAGGGGGTEYRDVGTVGGGGGDGAFIHHLDSVTSPMGETTRFVRGDNGRIERVEYPDGGVKRISYGYDAQPDTVVLPQGTALSFQHDAAGREVSRVSSFGEYRGFTYGPNDRIETMTDGAPAIGGTPACAGDRDCDGVGDSTDNCPQVANAEQTDNDPAAPQLAVAHYRFEEASGTTAVDSVGTSNGTLLNGATRVAGVFGGQAVQLESEVDDRVTVPNTPAVDVTGNSISVEAWVYPRASAYWQHVVHKEQQYALGRLLDGGLSWADSSNWCYTCFGSYGNVPLDTWTHVAATKSGSTVTLYINGQQVVQKSFGSALASTNNDLNVGLTFKGKLDDVVIYNRTLSAAEVMDHAQGGLYGDGIGEACDACPTSANPACVPTTCTDADGDGYGPQGASACSANQPAQFDCNDTDAAVHPGAIETCDGIDNDCDGVPDDTCLLPQPVTHYEYDPSGRFSGIVYPHGGSVTYDRDKLDRVTAVRVKATATASELVTGYAYDANGNLETVTDPLGGVTTFVYDSVDRLTEKHLPNGVVSTYTYDDRDRVLSVTHTGASGVLASVTYERSASGEPTKITREDGSYVVLTYDAALRLDTETYYAAGGGVVDAIDYDYDLDGNRTRKTSLAGGVEDYAYSAGFRLNTVTKSTGVDSFTYDGGGRVTGINRDGSTSTLEYNSDDKITHISGGSTDVRYSYDGVGRRVAKVEVGFTTRYLTAPNLGDGFESPQAVTDASGNVVATFVYAGGDSPFMKITPTGVEYMLTDSMGTVLGKTDGAGASTASIKYDGFGNVTSSSGVAAGIDPNVGFEPRFQGMSLDSGSGLYYVRARTYDAKTGRFLSRDPVAGMTRRPESMNPYVFANANPFLFIDPTGTVSVAGVILGVVAIVAVALALVTAADYAQMAFHAVRRAAYGRSLSDREAANVRSTFCASGTCSIDVDAIRIAAQGGPAVAFAMPNLITVGTDDLTDQGDVKQFVLVHEATHLWQFERDTWRVAHWRRGFEIIDHGISGAYDSTRVFRTNDDEQTRTDVVLRFEEAPLEAQAVAIADCASSPFYPQQCDILLSYVKQRNVGVQGL